MMRSWLSRALLLLLSITAAAWADGIKVPKKVQAGQPIQISTEGSGDAKIYIVGPAGAAIADVQLGNPVTVSPNDLSNAGHYTAFLSTSPNEPADFDIVSQPQPATISFLARPSRLEVNLHNGISGVAYVFDAFRNLVLQPEPVVFKLTSGDSAGEERTVQTKQGVAWLNMDSSQHAGIATFLASSGAAAKALRVLQQVPGEACNLHMTLHPAQGRLLVQTFPVRDCTGNAVPDGTIVTFTEVYNGYRATVEAPLKRGVAQAELPAHKGAAVSVATGEVLGDNVRWDGGQ
jgi:hypothetical protein